MNEIDIKSPSVEVYKGIIAFNNFEVLYDQALQLKSYIESVEVTEESVKATKKMLAAVNAKVKELEDKRIQVKKEILSPYEQFEKQVKQIVNVVKEADQEVRKKVKGLEEQEREVKEILITELFNRRKPLYPTLFMFNVEDFLTPKHLNKTTSGKSIEEEMVQWFETRKRDLELINTMEDSTALLMEYMNSYDLAAAMKIVNVRKEKEKAIESMKEKTEHEKEPVRFYRYTVFNKKDAMLLESFMHELQIEFKKDGN